MMSVVHQTDMVPAATMDMMRVASLQDKVLVVVRQAMMQMDIVDTCYNLVAKKTDND
jgi:hypothetical protein